MTSPTRLMPEMGRRIRTPQYSTSTTTCHFRGKRVWWAVGLRIHFYWHLRFKLPAFVGFASMYALLYSWKNGLLDLFPWVPQSSKISDNTGALHTVVRCVHLHLHGFGNRKCQTIPFARQSLVLSIRCISHLNRVS